MRVISALILAVPALVAATGQPASCSTGTVWCCNNTTTTDDASIQGLLAAVGAQVGGITGKVGLTCSPITAIGVGSGAQCSAQSVCCSNVYQNGLVNVGCTPININA
ncbi:hydrophobin [Schizophyllum fasciatum]